MGKYILRRFVYIIFVFFIISIIQFFIYKSVPGDTAAMMLEGAKTSVTPERYQELYIEQREKLGLDKPFIVQYFVWIRNMATGNFGYSIVHKMPVVQMAGEPMKNTISLNIFSLVFVFTITIFLGITTAVRKNSTYDRSVQVVTILGVGLPNFIFALIFIFIFAIKLKVLPISGGATPGFEGTWLETSLDKLRHMALPLMCMVFTSLGSITRYVRAAMIEALRMDYIRTARAKGLKEKVVIYSHAFRNSLIPVVTIMTSWFIGIFAGSLVIESTFLWNGMGNVMITSLLQLDFSVVLTFQMFYVILALLGNLIMDLGYVLVDPRVRLS